MDSKAKTPVDATNQNQCEPRPPRNRDEEINLWKIREIIPNKSFILSNPLNSSSCGHFSKKPFEKLQPIKLCEMDISKVHYGRYLICRVIGKPMTAIAAFALIEDLNGDVENIVFYNFRYDLDDVDWISVGTIFVIKEPWLQFSHSKTAFLRIDSPSDVIFVDPTDETFLDKIGAKQWYEQASKDAEEWRQKANECFKNGKYEKALFLYDRGIRCNPDLAVLYLNKALACLKTGAFYDAYESAKLGLEKGGDCEKALYRMGQAAYGMREWQKAANHFLEALKQSPANRDASVQLKRATARLAEERTGNFDFKTMFLESKKERNSKLDAADYMGPIEITNIPGKGRGIIASTDIKKGTLLVVSKSIGSSYSDDFAKTNYAAVNLYNPNEAALKLHFIAVIQYVKNNPQRAKEIYDLYAVDDTVEKEEVPFGVVDVIRIEKVCLLNRFGNGVDKMTSYDIHVFPIPSYFNHNCLANANRQVYGDVMILHACTDIKKNEEICLPYISASFDYQVRKKMFDEWKFTCTCKLCEIDSKDEFCSKRYEMVDEFCDFFKANEDHPEKVIEMGEKVLKKIRETYAKRKDYKIVLADMLNHLSSIYLENDAPKCFTYLKELITLVDDTSKYAIDKLPVVYYILGSFYFPNKIKAKEMQQKALETSFCTDWEHFKMVYNIPNSPQL